MSWIKIRTNLATDPSVAAIGIITKMHPRQVVGCLVAVWCWADPLTADGFIPHATERLIDDVAGKRGFAAAMIAVSWISIEPKGVTFPKWDRHHSQSAKARAGETERKRIARQEPSLSATPVRKMSGQTSGQCAEQCPDQRRGEERREEVQSSNPAPVGATGADGDLFGAGANGGQESPKNGVGKPQPVDSSPKNGGQKPAPKPREQNETLNALATVGGAVVAEITRTQWGGIQKCLREIKEVCPTVDAAEIQRRAGIYRRMHPDWELTPYALTTHWGACGTVGQAPAGSPVKPVFVSPEPPGWRGIIDREFPTSTFANITTPWDRLTVSDRDAITQAVRQYLPKSA